MDIWFQYYASARVLEKSWVNVTSGSDDWRFDDKNCHPPISADALPRYRKLRFFIPQPNSSRRMEKSTGHPNSSKEEPIFFGGFSMETTLYTFNIAFWLYKYNSRTEGTTSMIPLSPFFGHCGQLNLMYTRNTGKIYNWTSQNVMAWNIVIGYKDNLINLLWTSF